MELYYWPVGGRGEFIRLLFEDAGAKYTDINDPAKIKVMDLWTELFTPRRWRDG